MFHREHQTEADMLASRTGKDRSAVSMPAATTFLALQMAFFMVYGSSLVYVDARHPFINHTHYDWSTSVFQILGRDA